MTSALVLGRGRTALQVVRLLGRQGIPQYAVGGERSVVARSHWYRCPPPPGADPPTPASLSTWLGGLPFERLVLLPCSDDWALAVARLDPDLAVRFPSSLAPAESLEILLDKGRFAEAMVRLGVPHPRTTVIPSDDVPNMFTPEICHGAFLKPRDSLAFVARFGVKAFRLTAAHDAQALVARARRVGLELLIQEYIPGPATSHYFLEGFVDRNDVVRARFARQRLRMFPSDFGDSSYMVSVPLEDVDEAIPVVERLLRALRHRGLFQAEFKRDARDGRLKILEVNARPYGEIGFSAACGVDLCRLAYRDALGLPLETITGYEVGRRGVVPHLDLRACLAARRKRQLTMWSALRSWIGAHQPLLAWDDPVPTMVDAWEGARDWIRRRVR
jgi:predicted ATP-grasp superfamily ATP-dependent carboligase